MGSGKYKISIIFKMVMIVAGIIGILGQFGAFSGNFNVYMLNFFTVLSNLVLVIYFVVDVIWMLMHKERAQSGENLCPVLKGMVTASIMITFLVALFVLHMGLDMSTSMGRSFLAVHYIVPVMALLDWLIFDAKREIGRYEPLIWYIEPFVYMIYDLTTAGLRTGSGNPYIYPFMDVGKMGAGKVSLTIMILTVIYLLTTYLIRIVNKRIVKK